MTTRKRKKKSHGPALVRGMKQFRDGVKTHGGLPKCEQIVGGTPYDTDRCDKPATTYEGTRWFCDEHKSKPVVKQPLTHRNPANQKCDYGRIGGTCRCTVCKSKPTSVGMKPIFTFMAIDSNGEPVRDFPQVLEETELKKRGAKIVLTVTTELGTDTSAAKEAK